MGDLFRIDHLESSDRSGFASPLKDVDPSRSHIQSARFRHHRQDGKSTKQVMRRIRGGQRPAMAAHGLERIADQVEMPGFFVGALTQSS